jgi:tRNA A-37 threonylcarbamoyl transferase component Bud32
MANLVGTNLGKYRLVARLGRGGMAEVYKAYQPGLDRYVGIKVLHAHLVDDQDFINRFEREALAIGKLRHPNIVQAVDFDRDGEVYFMAMEFIDGPTLKDEVKARKATNKPFTDEEVSRIFTSLCSSIDYAHSRGMVHRDIKPANVMINDEGQVVLTDFGIARIMGATQYTQTGALSGTPAYMSPEQGQGERGDERSDIYSLGVMLYEMLTGIVPYDADTPFAVIMKHISEPLPMPSKINPDIREPVERVILKAMSKDPDDRYQTAGELARALRDSIGLSPDDTLRSTPLITVASAPQVEQIEHETGPISTMKPIQPAHGTMRGGGETVMAGAGVGTTQVAAAPDKKKLPMMVIIGTGLIIILLLIGVIGVLVLPSFTGPDVEATNTAVFLAAVAGTETAEAEATEVAAQSEAASVSNAATATADMAASIDADATEVVRLATETARDAILATLAAEKENTPELQVVTATPTETPIPAPATETPTTAPATDIPPTATPANTPEPLPPADTPTPAPPTDTPTPERPAISGKLAFPVENGQGQYDVIIASIPDGDQLGKIEGARQPNFRADGIKLLVNGEGGSFGENVFEASGTGGIERPVSGSPTDLFPVYKPDGTSLAYSNPQLAFGSEGYQSYLFVQCGVRPPSEEADKCAAIADFGIIVPAGAIGDVIGSHPVWTAGDLLAYKGCNTWAGGGSCGMFIVGSWATKRTSGGETPRKLADGTSVLPTDAKSGWIAYMSRESGDWEAYVMKEDGSGVVNISNNPGSQDGVAAISPDGQWVAFASNRDGSWAIFAAPISGGAATKLFDFPKGNPWLSGDKDWTNERMSWGP